MSTSTTTTDLPSPGEYPELDTQSQVPIIIGISVAFMVMSTIVVALRLYTRYRVIKVAGDDDITIGIAQVLNIGLIATTILQSAFGLGRHTWMVTEPDRTKQLELFLAFEVLYSAAQAVTKVSLLLQYRRIFRGLRGTRVACLLLYVFVVAWAVVSIVLNSLACLPMAFIDAALLDTCLDSLLVWSLTSAVSIVTNFAVVVVPIPATWSLQLPRKMRALLTILFGLGFCAGAVAIARVLGIKKSALSLDTTWDSSPVAYLSVIEVNVGIICACVITLRPLLTDMFPSLIKSSYGADACGYYAPGDRNNHVNTGTVPGTAGGGGGGSSSKHGKKSSRETMMTHADHGIYGLADLEANQVLNGSQEGLTTSAAAAGAASSSFFEHLHLHQNPQPAHFPTPPRGQVDNSNNNSSTAAAAAGGIIKKMPAHFSRMSTSITSGGAFPGTTRGGAALGGEPLGSPVHKIRTRSGDIMITRETTIREETVELPPASPGQLQAVVEKDDHSSWLSESSVASQDHNIPGAGGSAH